MTLEQSWYPSCVVKLTLRYDESLHVTKPKDDITIEAVTEQSAATRAAAGKRPRTALDAARQAQNQTLAIQDQRFPTDEFLGSRNATPPPVAEVEPLTFGTDSFTVIANRVPQKATLKLPHPRKAPEFTLVFDYAEFPIDPLLIRAVGVEIHLGAVDAEDFARGMAGEVDEDGRPLSILKTTDDIVDPFTGRKQPNEGTLLFYGTADTWDPEFSDKDQTVTIVGREIRAILIDTKVVPSQVDKIDLKQQINDVIGDLINSIRFEHSFRLTVAANASEWPNGIVPSPADANGLTAVRKKAASRPGAKVMAPSGQSADQGGGQSTTRAAPDNGSKASYWDLITNYCQLVGAMPYIVGSMLWIRPTHRIFDIVDPDSRIPTPFAGGQPRIVGDERIRVRRLVLGRDLQRLRTQRKFGGVAIVPTVQTISFDDRGTAMQRLIFGQWPPDGSDAASSKADSEVLRIPFWGIRSKEQLDQIARSIYEEIGRGETGGVAETMNLASTSGDNRDPDLLRLRPLEPVEILVDASSLAARLPVVSDVNNFARRSFSEEVEALAQTLGDHAAARAMVALSRGAVQEVLRYYQIVAVTFEVDRGVKTAIEFQNYIVPRNKVTATTDKNAPSDLQTTAVKVPGRAKKAKAKATQELVAPPPTPAPGGRVRRFLERQNTAQQQLVQDAIESGNIQ